MFFFLSRAKEISKINPTSYQYKKKLEARTLETWEIGRVYYELVLFYVGSAKPAFVSLPHLGNELQDVDVCRLH
jgi:hypothetical protein